MLMEESFNGIAEEHLLLFDHHRQTKWLNTIVPFVVYGFLMNAHIPLCIGMEIYLLPKVDAKKIPQIILKNKIN